MMRERIRQAATILNNKAIDSELKKLNAQVKALKEWKDEVFGD